jgi:hypothetical protein
MIYEVLQQVRALANERFFWKLHSDAELDLLIIKNGVRLGALSLNSLIRPPHHALDLDHLHVICCGEGKP